MLILAGWYVWLILAAFAVATVVTIEYESSCWSTGMLIIVLLFLQFYSSYKPLFLVTHFPVCTIIALAVYFAIGAVWIALKWTSHVYAVRDRAQEIMQNRKSRKLAIEKWELARELGVQSIPLQVSDHKKLLYIWWLWWPLSLLWTLCDDPLRRLGEFVYRRIGRLLQRISNNAFKDF